MQLDDIFSDESASNSKMIVSLQHAPTRIIFLCLKENNSGTIQERLKTIADDINSFNNSLDEPYYLLIQQSAYTVDNTSLKMKVI
ncbi:hypothetical protein MUJ63_07975 [Lachnospiraceae bacterium NSJ-143]|nr:hypothetical protein [Lachnospiraceae bacterium NSJ-143]